MSKKRKKTGGNPAKRPPRFGLVQEERDFITFMAYMVKKGESALEEAAAELIEAGATWEQIEKHRRAMRCKIASEALREGDVEVFEWAMRPLKNELEWLQAMEKAMELNLDSGQDKPAEEKEEDV